MLVFLYRKKESEPQHGVCVVLGRIEKFKLFRRILL